MHLMFTSKHLKITYRFAFVWMACCMKWFLHRACSHRYSFHALKSWRVLILLKNVYHKMDALRCALVEDLLTFASPPCQPITVNVRCFVYSINKAHNSI